MDMAEVCVQKYDGLEFVGLNGTETKQSDPSGLVKD